jgi:hypothetical protein
VARDEVVRWKRIAMMAPEILVALALGRSLGTVMCV